MSLRTVKKIKDFSKKEEVETKAEENLETNEETKPKQFFMMLNDDEESEEEQEEEAEQKKNASENPDKAFVQNPSKPSTNKKKKKKKNKEKLQTKEKPAKHKEETIFQNPPEEEKKSNTLEEEADSSYCLDIKLNLLNYNKELQRYFKNAKISEGFTQGDLSKKESKQMKMLKHRQFKPYKNYYLSYGNKPIGTIPEKFVCEKISNDEYGNSVFAFTPSQKYVHLQETYETLKNTNDPNNIFEFLNTNPFHIDCLFDVGDYFRLKGDFKQANALLEQILFLYEESFGFEFGRLLTNEIKNIVLSWEHNKFSKSLFNTIVKFIDILGKKACYKAALEYNKFLIKLNPFLDPVGGLLILDYNAISARNYDYLLSFVDKFCKEVYGTDKYSILFLPNFIYSCALAKFNKMLQKIEKTKSSGDIYEINAEDFSKAIALSSDYIQENHMVLFIVAILLYPNLIMKIISENEIHKQNLSHSSFKGWQKKNYKEILAHPFFEEKNRPFYSFLQLQNDEDVEGLDKIMEIYIERSKIIWKGNQINIWIKGTLGYILNQIDEKNLNYSEYFEKLCTQQCCKNIPFPLRRYKLITKHSLIEQMQRLDLNNIPDVQGNQGPPPNYNPLNMQQGLLSLLVNSLMPWNHLPPNQNVGANLPEHHERNNDEGEGFEDDFLE